MERRAVVLLSGGLDSTTSAAIARSQGFTLYALQGEGANTGRPAVFCRFAGCNLWSGHERDRTSRAARPVRSWCGRVI